MLSPGTALLFPRAALDEPEQCMFCDSAQAKYLATSSVVSSNPGPRWPRFVYINKPLGLKKVEKPEWNSPSSRQPVLWIPMHFFEMSLAEGKKKMEF